MIEQIYLYMSAQVKILVRGKVIQWGFAKPLFTESWTYFVLLWKLPVPESQELNVKTHCDVYRPRWVLSKIFGSQVRAELTLDITAHLTTLSITPACWSHFQSSPSTKHLPAFARISLWFLLYFLGPYCRMWSVNHF